MKILRAIDPRVIVTLAIGWVAGIVLLLLIPEVLNRGPLALVLLPLIALFSLLMVIRPQIALLLVLLFRAGVDPLIELTRAGDQQMGLGAGINMVVILLAGFVWLRTKPALPKKSFLVFWLLFLIFAFFAVFYAPTPFRAFRLFLNFLTYAAMAFVPFALITSERDKYTWLKWLLASSVAPVLLGNWQFLSTGGSAERIFGSFQHPNIFAFFLVLMIVVAVILHNSRESGLTPAWRLVLKIYLLNLFALLLFTKTRNAWIACWIVFFVYGCLVNRKVLIVTLVAPFLALFMPAIQSRIMDLFQGNDTSQIGGLNSFAWRRRLWGESLPWIARRPIEGYGLTSFMPLSQQFSDFADRRGVGAHNTYLEILFEMGLLGLFAFIGIWIRLLRSFASHIKTLSGQVRGEYVLVLGYVISYVVVCIGDNMNYYLVSNWYTWFFIGLMSASAFKFFRLASDSSHRG